MTQEEWDICEPSYLDQLIAHRKTCKKCNKAYEEITYPTALFGRAYIIQNASMVIIRGCQYGEMVFDKYFEQTIMTIG